jgi:hypothetical protein
MRHMTQLRQTCAVPEGKGSRSERREAPHGASLVTDGSKGYEPATQ